jgi:hypothetical protein
MLTAFECPATSVAKVVSAAEPANPKTSIDVRTWIWRSGAGYPDPLHLVQMPEYTSRHTHNTPESQTYLFH